MTRMTRALGATLALVAALVTTIGGATDARAAGSSTAVVVIDTGAGVRSAVIHFDGSINGIEALELAGADPVTYGFAGQGAAVCALDGVGNPAGPSCLVGPNSEYWAYYIAHGGSGSWAYSRGCACTVTVHDGDVEGWRYGLGAAPRASADFCAYVDCPPPPTSPSGGGSGGGGGDTGGTPPPAAGGGSAAIGASTSGESGPTGEAATDPAAGEATPPTSSTAPTSTTRAVGGGDGEEAQVKGITASRRDTVGSQDAGSPAGVAIAMGVLAATAAGAVVLRRRRMRAASGP